MKGLVLAGGTGSRLRPITHTKQKQMLPVANKPVLEYAIDDLNDVGIRNIGIVLGEQGHDEIKDYFGDGAEFGIDITYIYQGPPLGLAHAVGCARDFVGDDPFVVFLGDDIIEDGLQEFVSNFDREDYAGSLAIKSVDNPSRYGIVETDDEGNVMSVQEKPSNPPTDLAGVGVFLLTPAIFDEIEQIEPSWRGELELSDAIQRLLTGSNRLQTYYVDGWWRDIGTPDDLLAANRLVLDSIECEVIGTIERDTDVTNHVEVGAESVIEAGAEVRGPVSIGEGVTVRSGSFIGPYTTIADDVTVDGSHVESSVVLSGANLRADVVIHDSVIGENASISNVSTDESSDTNLVVGKDAEVTL